MSRAASASLVVAAIFALLLAWSALHHGRLSRKQIIDTPTYQRYGDATMHGAVPYRDFRPEYPPLALPTFILPSIGHEGDSAAYARWFDREMALCACIALIGTALCLRALRARQLHTYVALLLFAASPILIGSVVRSRFDWWPAALAVLALAALLFERTVPAAVLLALAIAAKLWPAALVPIFLVWLVRTRGRPAAQRFSLVLVAVVALVFVPFAVIAPHGLRHSFHAQFARPLQLESLGAAILIAVHHLFGTTLGVLSGFGSQNVAGPGTGAVATVTSIVGALALIAVWVLFARGPATPARLVASCAASVAALLAFGKVFSPQFVIWLLPFVVLVGGLRGAVASSLLVAVFLLTHSWFPLHYYDLADSLARLQSLELLARDLAVVVLFVVLAWPGLQDEVLGEHRSRLEALQRVGTQVD